MADLTHYIPAMARYTDEEGWQAACGLGVTIEQFSTEPTCGGCQDYLKSLEKPTRPPMTERIDAVGVLLRDLDSASQSLLDASMLVSDTDDAAILYHALTGIRERLDAVAAVAKQKMTTFTNPF